MKEVFLYPTSPKNYISGLLDFKFEPLASALRNYLGYEKSQATGLYNLLARPDGITDNL